jgi:Domain of unknown function (DUF1127)
MSTSFLHRTSPLRRGAGFVGAAIEGYMQRLILWRTRKVLLQLNDHMLKDIGLTREDIEFGCLAAMSESKSHSHCRPRP